METASFIFITFLCIIWMAFVPFLCPFSECFYIFSVFVRVRVRVRVSFVDYGRVTGKKGNREREKKREKEREKKREKEREKREKEIERENKRR